jgi:hypothetical protein
VGFLMRYDTKMMAWSEKFGQDAIEKLFQEYAELMLSLPPEKEVAEALVSLSRLREDEPDSVESAYQILERFFAELISTDKLTFSEFGLSTLGRESLNHLLSLVAPPVQGAPSAQERYADVIAAYNGPTIELNKLMKTEPFRTRFNEAVGHGLI